MNDDWPFLSQNLGKNVRIFHISCLRFTEQIHSLWNLENYDKIHLQIQYYNITNTRSRVGHPVRASNALKNGGLRGQNMSTFAQNRWCVANFDPKNLSTRVLKYQNFACGGGTRHFVEKYFISHICLGLSYRPPPLLQMICGISRLHKPIRSKKAI